MPVEEPEEFLTYWYIFESIDCNLLKKVFYRAILVSISFSVYILTNRGAPPSLMTLHRILDADGLLDVYSIFSK